MYTPIALRVLTDEALLRRLEMLGLQERECVADIVEHLMEVDRRESALDLGYASLFEYCVKKLGYSEGAAFLRIRAARAAAAFPEILERLRAGRIHLDAVACLSPHMNEDNGNRLLDLADGATKREVLAIVARLDTAPAPERDVVLPAPSAAPPLTRGQEASAPCAEANVRTEATSPNPEILPPLRHRFHFTGDDDLLKKISRLRGLLRPRCRTLRLSRSGRPPL